MAKKHIHTVCLCNITRSVWAEALGRKYSCEKGNLKFTSSGTLANNWSDLNTEQRIDYIANVAVELVKNPDNDFAYDAKNCYRANIEEYVGKLNLETLDMCRFRTDENYSRTVRSGLRELLIGYIAPHEELIRNLAMQKLDVKLPKYTNQLTVYDPDVDIYLAMSESNKTELKNLFGESSSGKIFTATEYTGLPLVEPPLGIFACANMDLYIDYVKKLEVIMKEVILKNAS